MHESWLRIAHRGASGTAPEHTHPAFQRAIDMGVDMVELDVQLSRDEKIVVIHDDSVDRTTSGSGMVRNSTLAELKDLDAGSWFSPQFAGERILTLQELLALVAGRVRLNVEIKAPPDDWGVLVPALLDLLSEHGVTETTVISCFEPEALQAVRRFDPRIQVGLLWHLPDLEEAWRRCAELRATSLHPFWMLASPEVLQAARQRGLRVLAWTVNGQDAINALVASGIDGIISDYPERLMAAS